MGFAGRNLYNLYQDGDDGAFPVQPEKARELARQGAEMNYPDWQDRYGRLLLEEAGHELEGLQLCEKAAGQGQLSAWYYVGRAHQQGKAVPKDLRKALECFEKGLKDPDAIGCANRAGELYFQGKNGVPQDYARAVQLFERAHAANNHWGNDMLGLCYLLGWGCEKNFARAKAMFEEADYSSDLKNYGLGLIYADGLGVPEDIKKGVAYLQKAGNYTPAAEAMLRFKKGLFGKWTRR